MALAFKHISNCYNKGNDMAELSSPLKAIFAQAGIELPKAGERLPLSKVDDALKGLGIDERMMIKSALNKAGLIDCGRQ